MRSYTAAFCYSLYWAVKQNCQADLLSRANLMEDGRYCSRAQPFKTSALLADSSSYIKPSFIAITFPISNYRNSMMIHCRQTVFRIVDQSQLCGRPIGSLTSPTGEILSQEVITPVRMPGQQLICLLLFLLLRPKKNPTVFCGLRPGTFAALTHRIVFLRHSTLLLGGSDQRASLKRLLARITNHYAYLPRP